MTPTVDGPPACPATASLGLLSVGPGGKHSGTVSIGRTGDGLVVGVVETLMAGVSTDCGLTAPSVGLGRLVHRSSGASSSCAGSPDTTGVLGGTAERQSSSRRRKVFMLRSVGTSLLSVSTTGVCGGVCGGGGTERVWSRNCLIGELMTELL